MPYYNEGNFSKIADTFNSMGYMVKYFYALNVLDKQKEMLPLVEHENISKVKIEDFEKDISKEDILIINTKEDVFESYVEIAKNKGCKIVNINAENLKITDSDDYYKHCENIIEKFKTDKKCISKYYDNISVIVLNYNNMNVIRRCIDTILENNERYNVEIIVVDNKSTDGSFEMLQQEYNDKIKLYQNTKNGCSSGRNLGVSKSTKDYIMFLDSDQWVLHKYWLETYLQILEANSNIGGLGWAAGWFNKEGYSYNVVDSFKYRYMPAIGLYRTDIGYLGTGGLILKKELFNRIDGFDLYYDPTCYEDTDLSLKIRNAGQQIAYTTYLGVGHLPHQTTKSGTKEHDELIKNKGDYFISKWKKINPKLLNYIK